MFGTSGIRGPFGTDVTVSLALDVGRALATDGTQRVVVGRDPRLTGPVLADALAAGVCEGGADVVDLGIAATPTIARSVAWEDADAGVAITASHNPPQDNGIKLWSLSGMAFDESRRGRIAEFVRAGTFEPADWDEVGERRAWTEAQNHHVDAVSRAVDVDRPLHVVVDIGNGAGGVTVDVLKKLGCRVETLHATPDGRFPSRPSEPTADNCRTLRSTVASTNADLGIAHDGDADRTMAVDDEGQFVPGDVLLALFARDAAEAGSRVAVPVNTSLAVDDALADLDASVVRTRVGDVFVAEGIRESEAVFGGEPSGAWIWPDETLCPDGTLAAAKLAEIVSRRDPLSALVSEIETYPLRRESHRIEDKDGVLDTIREEATTTFDRIEDRDGIRIDIDDGWLLIRASGTEPLVRLTAEAREEDRADELLEIGRDLLEEALEG
ncbi:MAG: phosphoglucosamine mutase [archaeon]